MLTTGSVPDLRVHQSIQQRHCCMTIAGGQVRRMSRIRRRSELYLPTLAAWHLDVCYKVSVHALCAVFRLISAWSTFVG